MPRGTTAPARAAALFHALSDETRLGILEMLRDGERCVCDLQEDLEAAQSRLSFHLRVLRQAGLVSDRREGRWSYYRINTDALAELHDAAVALHPSGLRVIDRQGRCYGNAVAMAAPSHSPATLRPARAADHPAVERLVSEAGLPVADLPAALDGFIVAEADASIVGVAGVEVRAAHGLLRSVVVDPAWRSRRLGRALVTRAIADAESRGVQALHLLTTTADRYFPRFGFGVVDRDSVPAAIRETREFSSLCPASAIVMCRDGSVAGGGGGPADRAVDADRARLRPGAGRRYFHFSPDRGA